MTDQDSAAPADIHDFVYDPRSDQTFVEDRCFLCGTELEGGNRTDEHVFPQWLLRRFDLYQEKLNLLNGTTLPYAQMKIPCCRACNNEHLSQLERTVQKAFAQGPHAVAELDQTVLFLWMSKIYYGLMFRELFLLHDRRDREAGTIVTPEVLSAFRMHHMLLQAARGVVRWESGKCPASIFVFRALQPTRPRDQFDYYDMIQRPFLALRAGSTVVVASLQDWGALAETIEVPALEAAKQLELHPLQFREVAAAAAYTAHLFNRTPKHLLHARDGYVDILTMPLMGLSTKPLFDAFDAEQYAHVLASAWLVPVEDVFNGSGIRTVLRDPDGQPWTIPWSKDHWFPQA